MGKVPVYAAGERGLSAQPAPGLGHDHGGALDGDGQLIQRPPQPTLHLAPDRLRQGPEAVAQHGCSLSLSRSRLRQIRQLPGPLGRLPAVRGTRAFWEHNGLVQIDTIDPLPGWQPGNPVARYVAALWPTR